jgi:hypothetical protein
MINKQPTIDDIYNFDAYLSTPGVREGLMERAQLGGDEFAVEDTDDGQALFFNAPHGEQVPVGRPVQLAAGPAQTVTDANPYDLPMEAQNMPGVSPDQFVRGLADTAALGVKGATQAFIGLPGDVISLARGAFDFAKSGGEFDAFVAGLSKPTGMPTTEDAKKFFDRVAPLGPDKMLSDVYRNNPEDAKLVEGIGEFAAPGGYIKGAKTAVQGVKAAGKALAPKAGEMLGDYMQRSGLQANLIAHHGTPHRFDKFDSSKIGTGEGAQAFGHGLYFAESKDVAKGYQTSISKDGFLVGNKVFDPSTLKHLNVKVMVGKGQLDEAIAKAEQIVNEGGAAAPMAADDLKTLVEIKAQGGLKPNKGRLFTVDIPDDMVAKMLDFDKPLSDQTPEIQAKLKAVVDGQMGAGTWDQWLKSDPDFKNLQDDLFEDKANEEVSALLREAGIPGIRYLDSGSRATPNITDKRLAGLLEKHNGNAEAAVDEMMASVYNTPKKKEQMREQFMRQLETPKTRNIVVFPGGETDIKILKTEGTK